MDIVSECGVSSFRCNAIFGPTEPATGEGTYSHDELPSHKLLVRPPVCNFIMHLFIIGVYPYDTIQ